MFHLNNNFCKFFQANRINVLEQVRHKSHKYIKRPKPPQNIQYQAMAQSLKAKGYLFELSIGMNEWHLFM